MDRYVQLHRRDDPLNDALQRHRGTGESFPVSAEIIPDNETMLSRKYRGQIGNAREVVSEDMSRLKDADVLCVRSKTKPNKEFIDSAPNLKLIIRGGVGIDNIDTAYCKEKGILVRNTPSASAIAVTAR